MYDTYLAHFGIKGMKWGVRRYRNSDGSLTNAGKARYKDIKEYQKKTYKKEYNNIYKKESEKNQKKISVLEKQATELAKKYNFDHDDGGGGETKADRKAGRKYINLWEKIEKLEYSAEDIAHAKATTSARNALIKKYGQQRITQFDAETNIRNKAKSAAFITGLAAVDIGIAASLIYLVANG